MPRPNIVACLISKQQQAAWAKELARLNTLGIECRVVDQPEALEPVVRNEDPLMVVLGTDFEYDGNHVLQSAMVRRDDVPVVVLAAVRDAWPMVYSSLQDMTEDSGETLPMEEIVRQLSEHLALSSVPVSRSPGGDMAVTSMPPGLTGLFDGVILESLPAQSPYSGKQRLDEGIAAGKTLFRDRAKADQSLSPPFETSKAPEASKTSKRPAPVASAPESPKAGKASSADAPAVVKQGLGKESVVVEVPDIEEGESGPGEISPAAVSPEPLAHAIANSIAGSIADSFVEPTAVEPTAVEPVAEPAAEPLKGAPEADRSAVDGENSVEAARKDLLSSSIADAIADAVQGSGSLGKETPSDGATSEAPSEEKSPRASETEAAAAPGGAGTDGSTGARKLPVFSKRVALLAAAVLVPVAVLIGYFALSGNGAEPPPAGTAPPPRAPVGSPQAAPPSRAPVAPPDPEPPRADEGVAPGAPHPEAPAEPTGSERRVPFWFREGSASPRVPDRRVLPSLVADLNAAPDARIVLTGYVFEEAKLDQYGTVLRKTENVMKLLVKEGIAAGRFELRVRRSAGPTPPSEGIGERDRDPGITIQLGM